MKKILPIRNFPHKFFSVIAVFALIAFLLTLKPVAEVLKKGVEALGGTFPPMDIFRNTAGNLLLVGLASLALMVAFVIAVPIIKVAVTITAVAVIAVGLFNIYKTFTGKPVQKILPEGTIDRK